MKKQFFLTPSFFAACALLLSISACNSLDLVEKNSPIPHNQWLYSFQPQFDFTISDTTAGYSLFIVLRHTDAYRYNNLWLNVGVRFPKDSFNYKRYEIPLGSDDKGWEGTGLDDIWEIRKPLNLVPIHFNKTGTYTFSLAQIMRENPLPGILSAGIRVEKIKP